MHAIKAKASEYIAALPSPQREICRALRELILDSFPQMKEEFKWRFPAHYHHGKRICLIGGFKQHAHIELLYGAHLESPLGQITGACKHTRHITFRSLADIGTPCIIDFVRQSIELSPSAK